MWRITHIVIGSAVPDEGGEIRTNAVTIANERLEEATLEVPAEWLTKRKLDVGSEWPDFIDYTLETKDLVLRKAKTEDWNEIYHNLWCYNETWYIGSIKSGLWRHSMPGR